MSAVAAPPRIRFDKDPGLHADLQRRVAAYFTSTGRSQRGNWRMHVKTLACIAAFVGIYVLLVFVAATWWQGVLLAVLLGLATASIGFNVQHDGGHQSYGSPWRNKLSAMAMDVIGGSSFLWSWKHGIAHHTYTNIAGHDTDIDVGIVPRLAPSQPWNFLHRFQHIYIWPLYGIMAVRWALWSDFLEMLSGRINGHAVPRAKVLDWTLFWAGKAVFISIAFAVPMLVHEWWVVLVFYAIAAFALGLVLSVVFQLAHCTGEAHFPTPADDGRIATGWAEHQLATTVNFSRGSALASWLLGGLNHQVEHHLFPRICHIHYPAIAGIVAETCRDHGVRYREHTTFISGLVSHYRWLRHLSRPEAC